MKTDMTASLGLELSIHHLDCYLHSWKGKQRKRRNTQQKEAEAIGSYLVVSLF